MKYLITGCPRSGTKFTANLLGRYLGYDTTFEKRGNRFTVSWKHIVSGYFDPPANQNVIVCDFDRIIHQVRHPLKVIASMTTIWNQSMGFIGKFVDLPDLLENKNQTVRNCMNAWYGWNKIIEKKAVWRYKIEDLPTVLDTWCKYLDIPVFNFPDIKNNINGRKHITLKWEDLFKIDEQLAKKIKNLSEHYGY